MLIRQIQKKYSIHYRRQEVATDVHGAGHSPGDEQTQHPAISHPNTPHDHCQHKLDIKQQFDDCVYTISSG